MYVPKMVIPDFDGDWLNWPTFKAMFEPVVHNDQFMMKLVKLQHLRAHLKGNVTHFLEKVSITDAGYDGAWAALVAMYGNYHMLLFNYIKQVIDCVPVVKSFAVELSRVVSTMKRS